MPGKQSGASAGENAEGSARLIREDSRWCRLGGLPS